MAYCFYLLEKDVTSKKTCCSEEVKHTRLTLATSLATSLASSQATTRVGP